MIPVIPTVYITDFFFWFNEVYPYESRTVYECTKITGIDDPDAGMKAAIKIKKQIPWGEGDPTDFPNDYTQNERTALEQLARGSCEHSPTIIDWKRELQDEHGVFPGAYIYYFLMTWVPGRKLYDPSFDFWKLPWEKRDKIRRSFRVALRFVFLLCNKAY